MALNVKQGERLVSLLNDGSEAIVNRWAEVIIPQLRDRMSSAEARHQTVELLRQIETSLSKGVLDISEESAAELRVVLTDLSRRQARQGFTPTEIAISVFGLKPALFEALRLEQGGDESALLDYVAYSAFIDGLGLFIFETYARAREQIITEQSEQLLELSTPVVKLWDGVVSVPLVGTLDSARAQVVMERLLQTLIDTGSPFAIIDITGVPAVDTQVAQHLLKTVMAARLMGAECIVSGIRPQIAQTIVALGIEFGDILTKATLADALRHAIRLSGSEVKSTAVPTRWER
jgi:rsbT co-antagonist protein RsbR